MNRYKDYSDILYKERPISCRYHMDIPRRAKQFAPFAALKGFETCVHEKEILYTPKKQLSEDRQSELNFQLRMLRIGEVITAEYFQRRKGEEGRYISLSGKVKRIDPGESIWINETRIPLQDLYRIQGEFK